MPDYLPGGEPFLFEGNSIGCLLVHGFTGTPYEMRGLGEFLATEFGYTVSGPVLAGHSTRVEHMAPTTWHDWFGSVEDAFEELSNRCDLVFGIGLSLGGDLVLHLARLAGENNAPLRGVVAVSAPIFVTHRLIPLFRAFPFLFRFFPYTDKKDGEDDTQDPRVRANHPAYDRTPTLAARSLILGLLPHLRRELPDIHIPVLLLQGRGDRTIPADSMPIIYRGLGSRDKRMVWLDKGGHLVLEDYDKAVAFQLIADFIASHAGKAQPAPSAVRGSS